MPPLPIQQIKSAASIVDVISEYVHLKKSGPGYTGRCPFHNEKTPSFRVNPEGQFFKCFGCNTAGDVIRFVMLIEDIPFLQAARRLAERFGVPLAVETVPAIPSVPVDAAAERRKRVYKEQIAQEAAWWQRRTLRALQQRAETVAGLACAWWGLTGDAGPLERRARCWRRAVLKFQALGNDQIVAMYTRRRLRMAHYWKRHAVFVSALEKVFTREIVESMGITRKMASGDDYLPMLEYIEKRIGQDWDPSLRAGQ